VQDKRSSERRERIREVEGRPGEQGQKGWRIDLTSRERSKRIDRNIKRKKNSKEKGRMGREETTRTSSGHAVTASCCFVCSWYLPSLSSSPPIINTGTSINLNQQRRPSQP
jgi:hypothetical protein